ncbi:DUF1275 domain protein [Aspergillus clavatus NRRL 1]|uniref:DUF1275 domain protein n=1 Tax=Aspergillus clavatus (strain ATCC 1007 / CBS 513.65 / DSM 816 / NCTC 3887 / NRRL 1 / QM 1276 / 107) TaxID=344612 RepID=A1CJL4_ASPCL|nr:DUF1275 domain protein [Aspergillus clavatus NRRL 1]EAW09338.1 DUF1275 domain protein [Aspergillus clavatus NRRL 1]
MNPQNIVFTIPPHSDDPNDQPGLWSTAQSTTVSLQPDPEDSDSNTLLSTLKRHFAADVDTTHTDLILVLCGFVSGLVDGLSFNAWGSFASMQTGNTVFIALGASGQPAYPAYLWAKSLVAVTVFILSNLLFIHFYRLLSPRRRSTLIFSFSTQTLALLAAALLVQTGTVSRKPEDPRAPIQWIQILPISLLSFQAAGQIVTSRILAFDEIPTVVLTTLLCDLLVDRELWARGWKSNPKRNRRAGAFVALFLGAMTAGGLSKVTVLSATEDGITTITITITRPHRRNAVDPPTAKALYAHILAFEADPAQKIRILTGIGETFSPARTSTPWRWGLPRARRKISSPYQRRRRRRRRRLRILHMAGARWARGDYRPPSRLSLRSQAAREFITRVHCACANIRNCPVPVIGRIKGYALGASLTGAASCGFCVTSAKAVFSMPEVRVGIPSVSVVEAALLVGLIGWVCSLYASAVDSGRQCLRPRRFAMGTSRKGCGTRP